jgi:enoyl-CoA hydratase
LSFVRVEDRGGVSVVALDRPPANAFAPELISELRKVLRESGGARALVLTSANPKLFSAGWDLPRVSALDRDGMTDFFESYCDLVRDVFAHPAPLVAALPGHAIAGGLIVAAAADERYAAEGPARFGLSEVALGVPLPASCLELFRFLLGGRRMERLAASAQNMAGEPAVALGLLDSLVPAADLLDFALERAAQLGRGSSAAYAEVKRRARAEALARFDEARRNDPFLDYWFSEDARTRIAALVSKLQKN